MPKSSFLKRLLYAPFMYSFMYEKFYREEQLCNLFCAYIRKEKDRLSLITLIEPTYINYNSLYLCNGRN